MQIDLNYAIQLRDMTKSFGTVKALDHVDLDIRRNTVHAIYGENGAGKSTLLNILYGLVKADAGNIYIDGKMTEIKSCKHALSLGIGMVHQSSMLLEDFSAIENIVLGKEPQKKGGIIDWSCAHRDIKKIIDKYQININLNEKVGQLSVGKQQMVELLKILYYKCRVILLDEPTTNLNDNEVMQLKNMIRKLVNENKTIVIITHKAKEIFELADYCTLISKGRTLETYQVSDAEFINKFTYCDVKEKHCNKINKSNQIVLEVNKATAFENNRAIFEDVSFKVYKGEIFGIAGVEDKAQVKLCESICSLVRLVSGEIIYDGKKIHNMTPSYAYRNGISYIPEDRTRWLYLKGTFIDNLLLNYNIRKMSKQKSIIDTNMLYKYTDDIISKYDITCEKDNRIVGNLSGGNQQKVLIGREIEVKHRLLIAIQPTVGLDVASTEKIYEILEKEKQGGKAILLVSYDVDEILRLSDRVSIMKHGKLSSSIRTDKVDRELIMKQIKG